MDSSTKRESPMWTSKEPNPGRPNTPDMSKSKMPVHSVSVHGAVPMKTASREPVTQASEALAGEAEQDTQEVSTVDVPLPDYMKQEEISSPRRVPKEKDSACVAGSLSPQIFYAVQYFAKDYNEEPEVRKLPGPIEEIESQTQIGPVPPLMRVIYTRRTGLESLEELTDDEMDEADEHEEEYEGRQDVKTEEPKPVPNDDQDRYLKVLARYEKALDRYELELNSQRPLGVEPDPPAGRDPSTMQESGSADLTSTDDEAAGENREGDASADSNSVAAEDGEEGTINDKTTDDQAILDKPPHDEGTGHKTADYETVQGKAPNEMFTADKSTNDNTTDGTPSDGKAAEDILPDEKDIQNKTENAKAAMDKDKEEEAKDGKGRHGRAKDNRLRKHPRLPHFQERGMTQIEILSPAVLEVLRCSTDYWPAHRLDNQKCLRLSWPFPILVHLDKELEAFQNDFEQRDCKDTSCFGQYVPRHLGALRDFVKQTVTPQSIAEEVERHQRGFATFEMLWYLLRPGDDVLADVFEMDEYEPFVVESVDWTFLAGSIIQYKITLWNMDSNSISIGPSSFTHEIEKFAGEKAITSLPIYPFHFLDKDKNGKSREEVWSHFEKRGELYLKVQRKGCWDYRGFGTSYPRQTYEGIVMVDPMQYTEDNKRERVILDADFETTHRMKPNERNWCVGCRKPFELREKKFRFAGYSRINPLKVESLTPHQYFLCDNEVPAFFVKHRKWEEVHVSGFKPVPSGPKMLDTLVFDKDTKDMIEGLTAKYLKGLTSYGKYDQEGVGSKISFEEPESGNDYWSADFVKGKGEGLIFLLHGKPGVGKTYTAECIAADARRPLLTLTSADIGTSPQSIEQNLMRWFQLATSWKAIMLIDEADIYMEHRTVQDLERNNLVASFLRSMEYYKGILFLTTNRVGTFDEAFISRINLTIYYKPFSAEDRINVWESFFVKLEKEREGKMRIADSTRDYVAESKDLLALRWNGREIRNAFQTAVALAEVEGDKDKRGRILIKSSHIRSTVKMATAFKTYMRSLHKKDEDAVATARGIRYDLAFYDDRTTPETPLR